MKPEQNSKPVAIAIDGPAGAGKSTMARALSQRLGFLYVDTGAIYRTVGLFARRKGILPEETAQVIPLLPELALRLEHGADGLQHMLLNGEDVSEQIRTPEISIYASKVSALPEVRAYLLELQRELARTQSVVMDGRDIGTVVLPDAPVKIFLTASPEARAKRRYLELAEKGQPVAYKTVLADMRRRDEADRNRAIAPLKEAPDAVLADTSELNLEESLALLLRIVQEKMSDGR